MLAVSAGFYFNLWPIVQSQRTQGLIAQVGQPARAEVWLQSKEKARRAGLGPPRLLPSLFPACGSAGSVLAVLTQGTEKPVPGWFLGVSCCTVPVS